MKQIFLIFTLLAIFDSSFACSCSSGYSFCNTHNSYNLTLSGVVVDTFSHGISLKVLHILNGTENRDTIKIWDLGRPYSVCNDSLSDARAAFLGSIGDTLILALPKIDTIKNTWDVVGDYKTPGFQCNNYRLKVVNNTVLGFISGSEFCHFMNNCLTSYNYDDYLIDFPKKSLNCQTWLSTDEVTSQELISYYPNPTTDNFIFTTTETGMLTITNHVGQFVNNVSITKNQTQISTENFSSGVYFLIFKTEKCILTRKLIVQH